MSYLLASIFFSALTVCFFKLFDRFGVHTFTAIVINYFTCAVVGNLLIDHTIVEQAVWTKPWFGFTAILGCLFIGTFYAIAQTTQRSGISISMVAAKLSVAVPVIFAVALYHEPVNGVKVTGILLSMVAVYLVSRQSGERTQGSLKLWYLPLIVFAGSGCIDTLLHYVEKNYIPPSDAATIICTVFSVAFLVGSAWLVVAHPAKWVQALPKNLLWGIMLGLPNYFCMYFLVKTLENFHGSYIFPINNIAIVIVSAALGVAVFKEPLSVQSKAGLAIALVSILLISLS